jgi:hypothetical protein
VTAITAAHYVENRKRGTTGLGALLSGKIVELPEAKELKAQKMKNLINST